jgi:hypothetical protein
MTKTETLRANLLASGYVPVDHASADPAFRTMVMRPSTGKLTEHTVFLMRGTLRGSWSGKRTDSIALPKVTARMLQGPISRTVAA